MCSDSAHVRAPSVAGAKKPLIIFTAAPGAGDPRDGVACVAIPLNLGPIEDTDCVDTLVLSPRCAPWTPKFRMGDVMISFKFGPRDISGLVAICGFVSRCLGHLRQQWGLATSPSF